MIEAVSAERHAEGLAMARAILARNYMNIEGHFGAFLACTALKDPCAAHHRYFAQGMIDSIRASGDGRSPETAYVVVASGEEYALARVLGVQVVGQAVTKSADGKHEYDRLEVRAGDKVAPPIYFNIDLAMAAMGRVMGLR